MELGLFRRRKGLVVLGAQRLGDAAQLVSPAVQRAGRHADVFSHGLQRTVPALSEPNRLFLELLRECPTSLGHRHPPAYRLWGVHENGGGSSSEHASRSTDA